VDKHTIIFEIAEIPDPYFPEYQIESGGDLAGTVQRNLKLILRTITGHLPGSASYTLIMSFQPNNSSEELQSRLKVYLIINGTDEKTAKNLSLLIEAGPLSKFYTFNKISSPFLPWEKMAAGYSISRKLRFTTPLHPPDHNCNIPVSYLSLTEFERPANQEFLNLDRLLHKVNCPIIICISAQPVNITPQLSAHTKYLNLLQSINRFRHSEHDTASFTNYSSDDPTQQLTARKPVIIQKEQDSLADDILRCQQRFHETLHCPNLFFSVGIFAGISSTAYLISSVFAEYAIENGNYEIASLKKGGHLKCAITKAKQYMPFTLSPLINESTPRYSAMYSTLDTLKQVCTVDGLSGLFQLPIGSIHSPYCMRQNTDPHLITSPDSITIGEDLECANIIRKLLTLTLCKHGGISGSTGSGKTTFIYSVLLQLFKCGIPWLVIETAKIQYRSLKTLQNHNDPEIRRFAEAIELYTAGNEEISPYRHNPFARPVGMSIDEHIENILNCLLASMPVSGPLPAILGEALEEIYEEFPDTDNPPQMRHLVKAVDKVMNNKGYSQETMSDIRSALEVRITSLTRRSLGKIFQCRNNYPSIDRLMTRHTILELDRLGTDSKCLCTLFLLTAICEQLKVAPPVDKHPRLVIVIEEAHNVAKSSGPAVLSPDIADPKSHSAELIEKMLAELRSLGVAIIILEQHISSLAPGVFKNTTTKLSFRQNDQEDRDAIGNATLQSPLEKEEIGRLMPGEAYFFTEGYYRSRKIRTHNFQSQYLLEKDTTKIDILSFIQDQKWFKDIHIERVTEELNILAEEINRFDFTKILILKKIKQLMTAFVNAKNPSANELKRLIKKTRSYKKMLNKALTSFTRYSFNRYICSESLLNQLDDINTKKLNNNLYYRFKEKIIPGVNKDIEIMDGFITRCYDLLT